MAYSESMEQFIVDQLSNLGDISTKKMFGALALYNDGKLFGAIMEENFCLRAVDKEEQDDYEKAGMVRHAIPNRKMKMPYFDVPATLLEDKDELLKWAQRSISHAK